MDTIEFGMLNLDTIKVCKSLIDSEIKKASKDSHNCIRGGKAESLYKKHIKRLKNAQKDLEQFKEIQI